MLYELHERDPGRYLVTMIRVRRLGIAKAIVVRTKGNGGIKKKDIR